VKVRHLVHVVGLLLMASSAALALTAFVAMWYGDGDAGAFWGTALGTAAIGFTAFRTTGLERDLSVQEGYAVVSLGWLGVGIAGAIPFLLTGTIASPAAALFESISGFTTTGATVFGDIESLPHGILFWRNLTQWIGGMGIIVLGVAILPYLGVGGMQLFKAEVPGPTPERLKPRITQTAKLLWYVYAGLTAAQVALYLAGGLGPFDAITHAFTTLSTGGFSPRNASIAAFDSAYVQYVTILFMYLAGISFTLHYRALSRGFRPYVSHYEWRFFTRVLLGSAAVVLAVLFFQGTVAARGWETSFRDALFQTVSIATTTGFVTTDYEQWALGVQLLLVLLMFMGGMAGSTGGGIKVVRIQALLRHGLTELRKSLPPALGLRAPLRLPLRGGCDRPRRPGPRPLHLHRGGGRHDRQHRAGDRGRRGDGQLRLDGPRVPRPADLPDARGPARDLHGAAALPPRPLGGAVAAGQAPADPPSSAASRSRVAWMRARTSSRSPSTSSIPIPSTGIGSRIATLACALPKAADPFSIARRVPWTARGSTGAPVSMARRKGPFRKGSSSPVRDRVPSGKTITELPRSTHPLSLS